MVLGISVFFLAAVVPDAITDLFNTNTTTWDATAATLFDLLPLAIVAMLVLLFVPRSNSD